MEDIQQRDRLIAEFMGRSYQFDYDLKYHSSWDWLMHPIDKIRNLLERFVFVQNSHATVIRGSNGKKSFDFTKEGTDVKTAFELFTQVIEWYNKEQSVKESDTSEAT